MAVPLTDAQLKLFLTGNVQERYQISLGRAKMRKESMGTSKGKSTSKTQTNDSRSPSGGCILCPTSSWPDDTSILYKGDATMQLNYSARVL